MIIFTHKASIMNTHLTYIVKNKKLILVNLLIRGVLNNVYSAACLIIFTLHVKIIYKEKQETKTL